MHGVIRTYESSRIPINEAGIQNQFGGSGRIVGQTYYTTTAHSFAATTRLLWRPSRTERQSPPFVVCWSLARCRPVEGCFRSPPKMQSPMHSEQVSPTSLVFFVTSAFLSLALCDGSFSYISTSDLCSVLVLSPRAHE
jgi:hypothetical protein